MLKLIPNIIVRNVSETSVADLLFSSVASIGTGSDVAATVEAVEAVVEATARAQIQRQIFLEIQVWIQALCHSLQTKPHWHSCPDSQVPKVRYTGPSLFDCKPRFSVIDSRSTGFSCSFSFNEFELLVGFRFFHSKE